MLDLMAFFMMALSDLVIYCEINMNIYSMQCRDCFHEHWIFWDLGQDYMLCFLHCSRMLSFKLLLRVSDISIAMSSLSACALFGCLLSLYACVCSYKWNAKQEILSSSCIYLISRKYTDFEFYPFQDIERNWWMIY